MPDACPGLSLALAFTILSADSGVATVLADLQLPQLQQHDCFDTKDKCLLLAWGIMFALASTNPLADSGFTMVLADLQLSRLQQHDCFVMNAGSLNGIGLNDFIG